MKDLQLFIMEYHAKVSRYSMIIWNNRILIFTYKKYLFFLAQQRGITWSPLLRTKTTNEPREKHSHEGALNH